MLHVLNRCRSNQKEVRLWWFAVAVCLSCCRRVAEDSIKNYQLWNHRRKIALAMGPAAAEAELQFCAGESTHGSQAGQAQARACQCLFVAVC